MLALGSATSGEIRIRLSGSSRTILWELLCHPVKMNSSQTHLLAQMNLAELVRQVESIQQHLLGWGSRGWNVEMHSQTSACLFFTLRNDGRFVCGDTRSGIWAPIKRQGSQAKLPEQKRLFNLLKVRWNATKHPINNTACLQNSGLEENFCVIKSAMITATAL